MSLTRETRDGLVGFCSDLGPLLLELKETPVNELVLQRVIQANNALLHAALAEPLDPEYSPPGGDKEAA